MRLGSPNLRPGDLILYGAGWVRARDHLWRGPESVAPSQGVPEDERRKLAIDAVRRDLES